MRVAYHGFFGKNHSWSVVAQNLLRHISSTSEVDVFSTNSRDKIPADLKHLVRGSIENGKIEGSPLGEGYDMTLSYTALKNASKYLHHSNNNRFLLWTYEFSGRNSLPLGFSKAHHYTDLILPPSHFAKQVFLDSGIPEGKLRVLPHGVSLQEIKKAETYQLKTQKSVKILINLGQIHARKNLPDALEMFGRAFTNKDDVCLILKIQEKKPEYSFELSFHDIYRDFETIFPKHAEVEIIRNFIPNIYSLYKACDITFSPSNAEGFGMVPLEGLACGLVPVASRYGGFLDFLSDNNSLLIEGNEFSVPPSYLYYQQRSGLRAFRPNIESGIHQIRRAVSNLEQLRTLALEESKRILRQYEWQEITRQLLSYVR